MIRINNTTAQMKHLKNVKHNSAYYYHYCTNLHWKTEYLTT